MTETRIYVASLTDYNNAILHGEWIDIDSHTSPEDIAEQVQKMLKASPAVAQGLDFIAEEWAIHDHEGFGQSIGEWESWENVVAWAKGIREYGEVFAVFAHEEGVDDPEEAYSQYQERWVGHIASGEDYAQEFYESTGSLPENHPLISYVDWSRVWRDMTFEGYSEIRYGGDSYIFHPA